jgi:hypothetical protein
MSKQIKFQMGVGNAAQRFTIEDCPEQWSYLLGVLHCTKCKHELHLEWKDIRHGTASCGCDVRPYGLEIPKSFDNA